MYSYRHDGSVFPSSHVISQPHPESHITFSARSHAGFLNEFGPMNDFFPLLSCLVLLKLRRASRVAMAGTGSASHGGCLLHNKPG